ncbi:hypothetical protein ABIE24_001850 [Mycetocola sp. 2940]
MRGMPSHGTAPRRSIRRLAALGTAALLTAALVSGCSGTPAPEDTTEGTTAASPAPSEEPRPTPSAEATPDEVGLVLPGSCEEIYGPAMFEALQEDLPPLNDPSMSDPNFSNTDELEETLRSLEYLQCTWGRASEAGIVTAVARVSEEQSDAVLDILESNGFDCYSQLQGTRCVIREETEGNALGESHFLREDVWVSTFWLNAPIRGYTENIVEAIWG